MSTEHNNAPESQNTDGPVVSRRGFFALTAMATIVATVGQMLPKNIFPRALGLSTAHAAGGSTKPKNILIITGSARVQGNSELLAAAFAKGATEAGHSVQTFHSGQDRMEGCMACDACWTTGKPCVVEDAFERLWPMLEQADMLVFCSPLYWYTFSGHIKNAIDRMYAYSKKDRLRDLKITEAMLLMCGESWFKKSFDGPAESYRQMLGLQGWKDRGRLFVTSVHAKGEIAGNSALLTAEKMGREA